MPFIAHFECTMCGRRYPAAADPGTCPVCGETGILEVVYDYEAMRKAVSRASLAADPRRSMWRYLPMLSIPGDGWEGMLATGWTPLYATPRLARAIGAGTVFVKDEGLNPTASLKDRASAVAVLDAVAHRKATVACSSTGNAASSLAGQAARAGLSAVIFVPRRAPLGKLNQLLLYGAKVFAVDGDYRATYELSRKVISAHGWYDRNAAVNPHLVEGKKTVALEIAEQRGWDLPDWVAVAVGDGCTVAGVHKGFADLRALGLTDRVPRILGVQAAGCAPFVAAARTGSPLQPVPERTLADSIAVGVPRNPVKALRAIRDSHGAWIAVPDDAILDAMRVLGATEGIFGEPAGVAAVAGTKEALAQGVIGPRETVVVVMTGNGLKDPASAAKAAGSPLIVPPDPAAVEAYLKPMTDEVNLR